LEKNLVTNVVTKELLADEFGKLLVSGGWRPSLMPDYINNVVARVLETSSIKVDYYKLKRETIRRMKELDPILFKRE